MKIIFAGTPKFGLPTLKALLNSSYKILAVYTQPDRPAGRGLKITQSPIKEFALLNKLPIYQPATLKDVKVQEEIQKLNPDVFIDVAYGLLLPKEILMMPKFGCINIHPSLLPRWRGAAPIQRAILAGDQMTGITIMQMDEGFDTGGILLQKSLPIEQDDTAETLHEKLAELGKDLLLLVLEQLAHGEKITAEAQKNDLSCYAPKINKDEAEIDWHKSAIEIDRLIRAFNPWPIAFSKIDGQVIRVFKAKPLTESTNVRAGAIISSNKYGIKIATGNGILELLEIQLPGGKVLPVGDILNAKKDLFAVGKIFA
jgi:methionyl-tRNA formyltransferase